MSSECGVGGRDEAEHDGLEMVGMASAYEEVERVEWGGWLMEESCWDEMSTETGVWVRVSIGRIVLDVSGKEKKEGRLEYGLAR